MLHCNENLESYVDMFKQLYRPKQLWGSQLNGNVLLDLRCLHESAIQCQLLALTSLPFWNALHSATAKTYFVLQVSKTPQHDHHQQEAAVFKTAPKSTDRDTNYFYLNKDIFL